MCRAHNVTTISIETNGIDDCIMQQFKDWILTHRL